MGFSSIMLDIFMKFSRPILMRVLKDIAVSGKGSDECLRHGFLPVPVHFYQPIPDIKELERRKVWEKVSGLEGINISASQSLAFLREIAKDYANECIWPNEPTHDPKDFYLHNGCFSYGCAAVLHCLIRFFKPKRIIEIGSGNSSKIIRDAIKSNFSANLEAQYTIIDPYFSLEAQDFPGNTKIIRQPVETLDLGVFKTLDEDDILFIDSSHVCKIGSDVNFEILEILPSLKKGVLIHFHDIPMPFEYSKIYAINPSFRMFWNESYMLQAFLICNNDFQILLPMAMLQAYFSTELKEIFPNSLKTDFGWVSGSFWIRRISGS